MKYIVIRIIKQIFHDKRSLALLMFAPLFVLTALYFILGESGYDPKVTVYGLTDAFVEAMTEDCEITQVDILPEDMTKYLELNQADGIVWNDEDGIHIFCLEKNQEAVKINTIVQQQMFNMQKSMAASSLTIQLDSSYAYDVDTDNQLDSLGYVIIGILSFFFVFMLSGISFVTERNTQTMERMLMSPISRKAVILGYTLGYGILSGIQSCLIILYSAYVLRLTFSGSVISCMLVMICLSFSAVTTGILLSIFANNDFQMIQFIPIIIIPQIFFSGLISIDAIPFHLGGIKYIIPSFYGCSALKKIMIYGYGIIEVWPYILGLLGYVLVLIILNILALKKYRKLA